jgi:choice-of-anchor B domain-containing protein
VPAPDKLVLALALVALAAVPAAAQVPNRNLPLQSHWNEFGAYSACWSYIHQDRREYAVLGAQAGTAIYNVTDPVNSYRVGFIPGVASIWREVKSYRNWIYVVTEAGGVGPGPGMQIINMTNPEVPVLTGSYTATFVTAHTVAVDTARAILICNGTRDALGSAAGMRILSLANPEVPVEIGHWPTSGSAASELYIHDCIPIGNRLYASSIYSGIHRIFDFTEPASPVQLKSWTYPGAFTHNSWPDASGNVLYVTDEVNGEPLKIFDISNLAAPVQINALTSNPQAIVHNAHVKGNELYLANYTEGVRILDISDPVHPAEFAWADSWSGASGGFHGVWEFCPFFPSGTVIASDMESGLYVYRPVRNYGLLRVRVISSTTGRPLAGATVQLIQQGESHPTPADGVVAFAPNPGNYTIRATKFGHTEGTTQRTVTAAAVDSVTIVLGAKPVSDFTGTVTATGSGSALDDAEVRVTYQPAVGSPYSLDDHTDAAGSYLIGSVPDDLYQVEVRRPGFEPLLESRQIGPGSTRVDYGLRAARTWDPLEAESGWTVGALGDNATGGVWTRVEPLGTGTAPGSGTGPARAAGLTAAASSPWGPSKPGAGLFHKGHEGEGAFPGEVQPEVDRTPAGTMCFVTGQGSNPADIGEADVDGGRTTLTTPALDATALTEARVGYWRWFYSGNGTPDDRLEVWISGDDGGSWVLAETTTGVQNRWQERAIRIADFVAPTDHVRLRFVAVDDGDASAVEAAIDDLVIYGTPVTTGVPASAPALAFLGAWPNPASGRVRLGLALPREDEVEVAVLDLGGRLVRALHRGRAAAGTLELSWDGRDQGGRETGAGVYLVRARSGGVEARSRLVRIR